MLARLEARLPATALAAAQERGRKRKPEAAVEALLMNEALPS